MKYSNGNVEFALHVLKRRPGGGETERYTIGVWEGTVLRAICHDACTECALAAIRQEIEGAGEGLIAGNAKGTGAPPTDQEPGPKGLSYGAGLRRH